MNRVPGGIPGALCVLAALALAAAGALAADPLTVEDVMRLFVSGTPPATLIERIGRDEVDFDLAPEIVDELRLAGLPDDVIAAMQRRLAERSAPEPAEAAPAAVGLRVALNPGRAPREPSTIRVAEAVSPGLRRVWQLEAIWEQASFEDLAVYLACLSPTHVPDHWRDRSPLGRDFVSMPRHRLLSFTAGATVTARPGKPDLLELTLPEHLDVPLEAGTSHRLTLGIALQVDSRFYRLTDDLWNDVVVAGPSPVLEARIEGNRRGRLDALVVRFERPDDDGEGDDSGGDLKRHDLRDAGLFHRHAAE